MAKDARGDKQEIVANKIIAYTSPLRPAEDTALHKAVESANLNKVKKLLEDPSVKVNMLNQYGKTALHLAAELKRLDIIQELLQHKDIDPMVRDRFKHTPFKLAVRTGCNSEIVELLATHGVEDINECLKEGVLALAKLEIIKLLFKYGAKVGDNLVGNALRNRISTPIIQELLANGAKVNYRNESYLGHIPLHDAIDIIIRARPSMSGVSKTDIDNISLLIQFGADIYCPWQDGRMACDSSFKGQTPWDIVKSGQCGEEVKKIFEIGREVRSEVLELMQFIWEHKELPPNFNPTQLSNIQLFVKQETLINLLQKKEGINRKSARNRIRSAKGFIEKLVENKRANSTTKELTVVEQAQEIGSRISSQAGLSGATNTSPSRSKKTFNWPQGPSTFR